MPDNEDATTSLGHSEVASVQNSVGEPVPELSQRPEEGTKVPSSSRRQHAGDVLPDDPPRLKFLNKSEIDERQVTARVIQSSAESGDAEGLARCPTNEDIRCRRSDDFFGPVSVVIEILQQNHVRPSLL